MPDDEISMRSARSPRNSFKPHEFDQQWIDLIRRETGLNQTEIVVRALRFALPRFSEDPGLLAKLPPVEPPKK